MTRSPSEQPPGGALPTGRSVHEGLRAAVAPVAACALALAGLTAWASSGAAGSPPQIAAGNGRVLLPQGSSRDTAAFFDITNIGGADDQLTEVTSPGVEETLLSRRENSGLGADLLRPVGPVRVAAGDTVAMSPSGLSVTTRTKPVRWQAGDMVPFVLHFRYSAPVEVVAVVVRPGS
ncbi:copper chaperone PCu(A)C [Streptomyces xanthophaeus]|uniref:copper chaperone PCu(A)C n=1 Tax=Streptomyces xanthophaeus TaxID=67385 RepID=UPI0026480E9D|nr:copper chaperone PCu(A)C [Streptomyces xanthophaeus]WKD36813.1 copper chaperone PCu(A)C [Streptomyces xanthophaeus]